MENTPPQKNQKSIEDLLIFTRKSGHFGDQKYTSTSINFSIFGRGFGRVSLKNDEKLEILVIFSILPYTDGFVGLIFDITPKNRFSRQKSSKILKVQKWCQNGSNSII